MRSRCRHEPRRSRSVHPGDRHPLGMAATRGIRAIPAQILGTAAIVPCFGSGYARSGQPAVVLWFMELPARPYCASCYETDGPGDVACGAAASATDDGRARGVPRTRGSTPRRVACHDCPGKFDPRLRGGRTDCRAAPGSDFCTSIAARSPGSCTAHVYRVIATRALVPRSRSTGRRVSDAAARPLRP